MSVWPGRRVLVTGGASFIGSHLVDALVRRGARVRVADDFSSGTRENLRDSLSEIALREGDVGDRRFAAEVTRGQQVVFHLAAQHGGRGFIEHHPADCAANMVLDGVIFREALQAGVERVCFASSACVYPTSRQMPAAGETSAGLQEPWADPFVEGGAAADREYGWAKLMGEMALRAYHTQYGLKSVSCRLFTVYGERENATHSLIALIAKAFAGMDPYEIWGDGNQDRNFTYVGDIVDGLIRASERIEDGSAVNLGAEERIRIRDAAALILEIMDVRPKEIRFDPSKPVGVYSRAADLARARAVLDWSPKTSFAEGLRRTIDWYVRRNTREEVAAQLGLSILDRRASSSGAARPTPARSAAARRVRPAPRPRARADAGSTS